ncbi:MAG: S8 family serine peptidase [Bacteroidetes bacterium]|nr:S8 family serine peptidase [Bacteroidota bacterium]MBU2507306.1 S8 family serine peptidase [Bacteroidota bacterium]
MKLRNLVFVFVLISSILFAQEMSQTFLSLKNTGVQEFLEKYPDFDGRGTIVLILDTGVDMGIDGLIKNPDGSVKVIDAQDFTGQGDIKFFEADIEEDDGKKYFENEDMKFKIWGADKLALKAVDDDYFIGMVPENLWVNSGSGVSDINGNDKKDDQFYFVTFKTKTDGMEYWAVYFDTDSDGDLSNEKPLRNYKENFDAFTIKNAKGLPFFTLALNIFPEKKIVSFYFDDGSHGSHCAGISAGYMIGETTLNGVAPGANVIGLKLGNNNFAGGATVTESMKKSYLYADKISKERKEPCIINMSFGIGSEIEARSEMAKFLEKLTKENPYLYICTSNGNEGPGLSTSGLPAASSAVFSSGAVLAEEVGNDLYGAMAGKDILLHFSSRGGEVSKPDVIAPGACVSTIPNFSGGDRFWGTSMASPYSAGVMALLLSAAKQEFPEVKIPSQFLYKAIRESAVKMSGYTHVDQGGGYINALNAYELLKKYINSGELNNFETYSVTSIAPNMPDNQAPNLYIRNGSYITGNENYAFNVERDNAIKKDKFYRIYDLKSDSDWLIPIKKKIHLRNKQGAAVDVKLDKSKMTAPGLYNGKIYAYRSDKSKTPEFEMMATVVIPNQFNSGNGYAQTWENEKLAPGMHKRYFLSVPAGASNLKISLTSEKKEFTSLRYYLHDPDGRRQDFGIINSHSEGEISERYFFNPEAGVYELVVLGQFTAKDISEYDLSIEFDGIKRIDDKKVCQKNNSITVVNLFEELKSVNLSGEILGWQKSFTINLDSVETFDYPFEIKKGESSKEFEIEISKEDFNKVTDFALMIYDESGKALNTGGLSYKNGSIGVRNKFEAESTKLKLTLIPAFANEAGQIKVSVTEKTLFEKQGKLTAKNNGRSRVTLYPGVSADLSLEFAKPENVIPNDSNVFGKIKFNSEKTDKTEFQIPILFNF